MFFLMCESVFFSSDMSCFLYFRHAEQFRSLFCFAVTQCYLNSRCQTSAAGSAIPVGWNASLVSSEMSFCAASSRNDNAVHQFCNAIQQFRRAFVHFYTNSISEARQTQCDGLDRSLNCKFCLRLVFSQFYHTVPFSSFLAKELDLYWEFLCSLFVFAVCSVSLFFYSFCFVFVHFLLVFQLVCSCWLMQHDLSAKSQSCLPSYCLATGHYGLCQKVTLVGHNTNKLNEKHVSSNKLTAWNCIVEETQLCFFWLKQMSLYHIWFHPGNSF